MNLVENFGHMIGLFLYRFVSRTSGVLLLLVTVTLTLGKTILYFIHDQCSTPSPTDHNFPDHVARYLIIYILPNSVWIVVPFLVIRNLFSQLRAAVDGVADAARSGKKKN